MQMSVVRTGVSFTRSLLSAAVLGRIIDTRNTYKRRGNPAFTELTLLESKAEMVTIEGEEVCCITNC